MLRLLRECGMGQAAMEEMVSISSDGPKYTPVQVQIEVADLVERVKTDVSNGVCVQDLAGHVDHAVGSLINQVLFGYRFAGVSREKITSDKQLANTHEQMSGGHTRHISPRM